MKPDKDKIHNMLLQYNIHKLHSFTNTQTNKIFRGNAQTPTCYFLLENSCSRNMIELYDTCFDEYISYPIIIGNPVPIYSQKMILKLSNYVEKYGYLLVKKTNMPSIRSTFSDISKNTHIYKNIKTCVLEKRAPKLVFEYSNIKQSYSNKVKIVLAHKMYGFPFFDKEGLYGISYRDNYVILDYSKKELERICNFLSTKFILYLYEATRYRMKYLEKYAFELIPDITKIEGFPSIINDNTVSRFFGLSKDEMDVIMNFNKDYSFF